MKEDWLQSFLQELNGTNEFYIGCVEPDIIHDNKNNTNSNNPLQPYKTLNAKGVDGKQKEK